MDWIEISCSLYWSQVVRHVILRTKSITVTLVSISVYKNDRVIPSPSSHELHACNIKGAGNSSLARKNRETCSLRIFWPQRWGGHCLNHYFMNCMKPTRELMLEWQQYIEQVSTLNKVHGYSQSCIFSLHSGFATLLYYLSIVWSLSFPI